MAVNNLPTLTDSKPGLRSYRKAASILVQNERLSRGKSCPLEPCESESPACVESPRICPTTSSRPKPKAVSRCRSRTPSPPQASTSSQEPSKTPRSISPGGTPATSAGAALRRAGGCVRLRVRWADALVASVRTRPRTLRKDVATLFYSRADEKRFRREAEKAREVEAEWCESLEEDSLTSLSDDDDDDKEPDHHKVGLWSPPGGRKDYAISKAVVVFGNSTMTYGGSAGSCALEAALEAEKEPSFLFDDAAFWNGQLTWS